MRPKTYPKKNYLIDLLSNEMKLKEVMTRMPYTVGPDVAVDEARQMMKNYRIRHLPVLDHGELAGIISDRDLRSIELYLGPGRLTVREIMTAPAFAMNPEEPLSRALAILLRKKIDSVLVVNRQGVVIGVFTTSDALAVLMSMLAPAPQPLALAA